MKYKGAAIQYDCHFMDKEKNLAALANLVRQAASSRGEAHCPARNVRHWILF